MASFIRPSSASVLRQVPKVPATRTVFYSIKSSPIVSTVIRPAQKKDATSSHIASFHASAKKEILKPLPQVVHGTMNDAAPIPHSSPTHGSYHWTFERLVAASLIPLTVAPFAAGTLSPVTDSILCAALVLHSHIGFQALIIDYVPEKRVPKTRALFKWGLRAATLTVAVGLYEFETNDVGLTEAIKRIWKA